MPVDTIPLPRPADIQNNIGGLSENMWVAPINHFTLFAPIKTWAVKGDSVIIDDDHTFTTGKGFLKLQLDYQKNMFEGAKVSEFGSLNREYTIKGFYYGLTEEATEAITQLQNLELCVLVKKLSGAGAGKMVQFGIPEMFARLDEYKETSATVKEGYAGYELTFKAVQPSLIFYQGVVTLKP